MTRSLNFWRGLSMPIAASILIFTAGCASDKAAKASLAETASQKAQAGAVSQALALARPNIEMPNLPGDCTGQERSGVAAGERLDAALVKTDAALAAANDRVRRCARFYNETKAAHDVVTTDSVKGK